MVITQHKRKSSHFLSLRRGTRQMDLSAAVQGKHLNSTAHPGAVVNWAWMEATGCTWSDTWHPQPEMGMISMPNHSHEMGTISTPDHSHDWALGFSSGRNLPWILLGFSQQRNSASASVPLSQLSCDCHLPCSSQTFSWRQIRRKHICERMNRFSSYDT